MKTPSAQGRVPAGGGSAEGDRAAGDRMREEAQTLQVPGGRSGQSSGRSRGRPGQGGGRSAHGPGSSESQLVFWGVTLEVFSFSFYFSGFPTFSEHAHNS